MSFLWSKVEVKGGGARALDTGAERGRQFLWRSGWARVSDGAIDEGEMRAKMVGSKSTDNEWMNSC